VDDPPPEALPPVDELPPPGAPALETPPAAGTPPAPPFAAVEPPPLEPAPWELSLQPQTDTNSETQEVNRLVIDRLHELTGICPAVLASACRAKQNASSFLA